MKSTFLALSSTIAAIASTHAVTTFTETFDSSESNWKASSSSVAATHHGSGGIGNSGYISSTTTFTSGADGGFPGAPPLQVLMRANDATNASNDAFVGNWLAAGATVSKLTLSVRHNYSTSLDLYARFASSIPGSAASNVTGNAIAPNTWTQIEIPITNSSPPFLSFGGGDFNSTFSAIQNLQFGVYAPASTTFTNLTFDVDNVSITVIPEPSSLALLGLGSLALLRRKRR